MITAPTLTMPPSLVTYNGGKGGAGTYQAIINEMPAHARYFEPFLGGGKVMYHKLPALINSGSDIDGQVIAAWNAANPYVSEPQDGLEVRWFLNKIDALEMLPMIRSHYDWEDSVIYCDPPFPMAERRSTAAVYANESDDRLHESLIEELLKFRRARIMLSTYDNPLYKAQLVNWRTVNYSSTTRRGHRIETLYMNFDPPKLLHDYRYLGTDYRDRERIRKRIRRETAKLAALPAHERIAIIQAINGIEA
jgi:DNA adenine methylase